MTLAIVKTKMGSKEILATLTDAGWESPQAPILARILNLRASPSDFGPSYGDPAAAAANKAATLLDGAVTYARESEPGPPGTVF